MPFTLPLSLPPFPLLLGEKTRVPSLLQTQELTQYCPSVARPFSLPFKGWADRCVHPPSLARLLTLQAKDVRAPPPPTLQ